MCHTSQIKWEATEFQVKFPTKIFFHFNIFLLISDFYLCKVFVFTDFLLQKDVDVSFMQSLKALIKTIFTTISFT